MIPRFETLESKLSCSTIDPMTALPTGVPVVTAPPVQVSPDPPIQGFIDQSVPLPVPFPLQAPAQTQPIVPGMPYPTLPQPSFVPGIFDTAPIPGYCVPQTS